MDDLTKRMEAFSALRKKSKFNVDSLTEKLRVGLELYRRLNKELSVVHNELGSLNEKIGQALTEHLDIASIKALNLYAEKVNAKKNECEIAVDEAKVQLHLTKEELTKSMTRVKVFENAFDSTKETHLLSVLKKAEKDMEDLWVSQRRGR